VKLYQHFSVGERLSLQIFLQNGKSLREIAKLFSRNVSSISRELQRNKSENGSYNFEVATSLYIDRRRKSVRKLRLLVDNQLILYVEKCLDKFWSPEIITAKWKAEKKGRKLSHSTIYKAITNKLLPDYSAKKHLRRRGKRQCVRHNCNTIKPDYLIKDWLEDITNRSRIGDWEGDTLCGAKGKGGLITLIDRKSRLLVANLVRSNKSEETKDAILQALQGQAVKSLSLDNGSEFAEHKKLQTELGVNIYFAAPRSPWQRPTNENVNGLLRFFFPKGCNFLEVTQEQVEEVLALVNNRPRKCLGWLSPIEFLSKCCT